MDRNVKKIGRPTEQPKTNLIKFRCDSQSKFRLESCAQKLSLSKSEVIRLSIDRLYLEIINGTKMKDEVQNEIHRK